ncbi:hypothetical protein HU200_008882 [Digitaria exilis]|uniref:Uncharacterized protein n=1 Tax=Digitaria exilis TaxID=1010633 RepID=A0A835KRD4_9POAL|nr:hypothetical protein HU200_008882 [Digitaria exilis]CAB3466611.1 unnamed protein product [Digitaria exilis]
MDSDQDSAADDWVILGSGASTSDDDGVLALSSGCATPASPYDYGSDSDADADPTTALVLAACADHTYPISDAEDDDLYPAPSPPQPRPISGLFHHTLTGDVAYAAFDPLPPATVSHHAVNKQLVPDPTFSTLIPDDVVRALASTRGLVCLRGAADKDYYVANPLTFSVARLPRPDGDHWAKEDKPPGVVITFDVDDDGDGDARGGGGDEGDHGRSFYRPYRVVVAFHVEDGAYAFETFSSRTWEWTIADTVALAENVVPASGVGALGCAFWQTTMGFFLCFEPVSGCADLVPAPMEVTDWTRWELGEMEGALSATCTDDKLDTVVIVCPDLSRRTDTGDLVWTMAGHFEGGCLRGRGHVTLLRSQGKAEVVMWDRTKETVVAMDLQGRTTRTITLVPPGTGYYDDFIPYVSSLAAVSASG